MEPERASRLSVCVCHLIGSALDLIKGKGRDARRDVDAVRAHYLGALQ